MSRFASFSAQTAPITTGKNMVRFSDTDKAYVAAHGYFPEGRDGRGDYMHIQLVCANGACTASYKEDKLDNNPRFYENLKLHFDGKTEGDGYNLKCIFDSIRTQNPAYAEMTAEQILSDMLDKEFPVWFYRYKKFLQVAFSEAEYNRMTGNKATPNTNAPKLADNTTESAEEVEDDIPLDLDC